MGIIKPNYAKVAEYPVSDNMSHELPPALALSCFAICIVLFHELLGNIHMFLILAFWVSRCLSPCPKFIPLTRVIHFSYYQEPDFPI
jgi:hypothetical protein